MALLAYGVASSPGYSLDAPYVVVDLETTGLSPTEDRIVEIAIGRVEGGRVVDEWATLIDPGRDPGPTFLHHISARMLEGAPRFEEIAGEILSRLDGAVFVAHNAAFEESFLEAEIARLGLNPAPVPALCTLKLARAYLAAPNYRLATCCEISGIALNDAHTALGDVRATALLLPRLLELAPKINYPVPLVPLPRYPRLSGPRTRATSLRRGEQGWMSSLLSKLPFSMSDHDPVLAEPYLDALAEALSDGKLTGVEARALSRIAGRAGLGAAQVVQLNQRFLDALRDAALTDGTVDQVQFEQLRTIAGLLDLPDYFADVPMDRSVSVPAQRGPKVWVSPSVPQQTRQRLKDSGMAISPFLTRNVVAAVVTPGDPARRAVERAGKLGVKVIAESQVDTLTGRLPAPVAPAGWYADPTGRFIYRYWNGAAWTAHVSPGDGSMQTDPPVYSSPASL